MGIMILFRSRRVIWGVRLLIVFAKNFRGFRDIRINLEHNNFLVGDNSSGKTSIIYLIEYICRTDLHGIPTLNADFNVGRYDFFSPYFDYENVTIGFQVSSPQSPITRIVTLEKLPKARSARAIRCSYASPHGVCVLRSKGNSAQIAFVERSDLSLDDIIDIHHSLKDGFDDVDFDAEEILINDPNMLFSSLGIFERERVKHLQEMLFSSSLSCRHIGPMRAMPESFYQFDRRLQSSGGHFATMMDDFASAPNKAKSTRSIKKFGRQSGLFENFRVQRLTGVVDNPPLAAIVTRAGKDFMLNQVGIGVSQVAPILAETQARVQGFVSSDLILVEQPELHLHPIAQAALGEYIWDMSSLGMKFVLETHSDFLIDRYRSMIRDKKGKSGASIIYCYSESDGNHYQKIDISDDGKLIDAPKRYSQFFLSEFTRTMF